MSNKKHSASIGFWLVLGSSKEHPLLVCPALISKETIEDINTISIEKVWKVQIQTPDNANKNIITTMIPEIINISNLNKKVSNYKSLWEIDTIKAKCEALATKYISQFKEVNKQNYGS